jgi:DNA-binding response OmpR family regulator
MSGKELSDAARANRPMLKVLYTSGYTRNSIVHGGRLDAGVALLNKPFTSRDLADRIRAILDAGKSKRLLIAEADANVRLLAVDALAGAGFHAEPAATAAEALGKLRAAQGYYDAVVIDMELPDKQGRALLHEIRELYADMPAILLTSAGAGGWADARTVTVKKPYSVTMLRDCLATLGVGT